MEHEICGSVTLPHMSSTKVVSCFVRFVCDCIELHPRWGEEISADEALGLLLNSPGVTIGEDTLKVCFDVEELRRRNSR